MSQKLSRRGFLGCACCAAASVGLGAGRLAAAAEGERTNLTPDQALELLKEGNRSFKTDSPVRAVQGRERRLEIARGQTPFATLVSCVVCADIVELRQKSLLKPEA